MIRNDSRSVFFHSSLMDTGMSVNEALLFSHLCFLDCKQNGVKTFRKSLATYLLFSKDTVNNLLLSLSNKQIINVQTINAEADGLEKHRFQVSINEQNSIVNRFYKNIKRIVSKHYKLQKKEKLNLVSIDLSIIEESLARFSSSSAHLHKACVAYGILNNVANGKRVGLASHQANQSHVTVNIKHRLLAKQMNICLNTAKSLVKTLIDAKCIVIQRICSTTRQLNVLVTQKVQSIKYQLRKALALKGEQSQVSDCDIQSKIQTLTKTGKITGNAHLKFILSSPMLAKNIGITSEEAKKLIKHL